MILTVSLVLKLKNLERSTGSNMANTRRIRPEKKPVKATWY